MATKNDLSELKYLVLEVDNNLNENTEKFFEKMRIAGDGFSYKILSPLEGHSTVVQDLKFGGFDVVIIEPTVYRASAANKIAHDISHAFRRKDLTTLPKKLYIMQSKKEIIESMYTIGPDGIASISAILRIIPTFIFERDEIVQFEVKEFYKLVRPILFEDANTRFYSENVMSNIRNSVDTKIRITKADCRIPFIALDYSCNNLFMNIEAKGHDELIRIFSLDLKDQRILGGYMDVYHGSKVLVFLDSNDDRFEFPQLDNLLRTLASELAVHYPEYRIECDRK